MQRLIRFIRRNPIETVMLAVLAGLLGVHVVWFIPASDITSLDDFSAHINRGQPTVVAFYSNL